MDIPRKSAARNRRIKRIIYGVVGVAVIGAITLGVSRLKPASPTVDRATVWVDTVKRGSMLRQVRGLGTLVPEDIRWIPATTEGRVEKRLVKPGAIVKPETVLIELSNPTLEQDVLAADAQLKAAEASYENLKVQIETQFLNQKAQAATVQADYSQAKIQAEVNEDLSKKGLVPELTYRLTKVRAEELTVRNQIEHDRLSKVTESAKAQLAVQQAEIDRLRSMAALRHSQLDALHVRAGIAGVVQVVLFEVGAQVTPGTNLARVADPGHLKAELKIPETQTKDITIGQPATIDTRNGLIQGRVSRIDPSVQNGTRTVDVELKGELPKGAVPDLSVDGTVELERLENVLYVGRPVQGQENSTIGIFKLDPDGKTATRVHVKLGRSSVSTIEILDGLKEGDQVILSDMSAQDNTERIRLQ